MKIKISDKKTLVMVISVCMVFVLVFGGAVAALVFCLAKKDGDGSHAGKYPLRGVWIATVSNIDFPSAPDLGTDELKAELDDIVETTANAGLDTIFFQVRPTADALYASDIFPPSKYMSSDGALTLDALDYLIQAAHNKNIGVHAWINPLRVATGGTTEDLPESSPARRHSEWTVKYDDGKIYFDCGNPEVIDLICDGVREVVSGYNVDGIIFDDYFYPYPQYITAADGTSSIAAFNDSDTFKRYGGDYDSIEDWRRDNVNKLISEVYDTIKAENKKCMFGVAPFGIWKNGYGDESGSETRGAESYNDIYCDTLAWVNGGYVDYIAPQLYWRDTDSASRYDVLCDWWAKMLDGSDVRLLISHAAYRYEDDWESPQGIMSAQVKYASNYDVYGGSIFYGYDEIKNNTNQLTDELKAMYKDSDSGTGTKEGGGGADGTDSGSSGGE